MASIDRHDILNRARRAGFGIPIYDREIAPRSNGTDIVTTYVAAPDLVSIVSADAAEDVGVTLTHTIDAQPDCARDLQVRKVDGGSVATKSVVMISGYDYHGDPVSEQVWFNSAGSATKTTKNCYRQVVSFKSKIIAGAKTAVTFGCGAGTGFQLPVDVKAYTDVLGAVIDTAGTPADDTIDDTTIDVVNQKYVPGDAPNGTSIKYFITIQSTLGTLP